MEAMIQLLLASKLIEAGKVQADTLQNNIYSNWQANDTNTSPPNHNVDICLTLMEVTDESAISTRLN